MQLICVDIEHALPAIPPCTQGEQWVLARLHGRPLGYVHPLRDGCDDRALAALIAEHLGRHIAGHLVEDGLLSATTLRDVTSIPQRCPNAPAPAAARLTVAVCTRDRASLLRDCLRALTELEYPEALLEIIVVDNAPTDGSTRATVGEFSRVRYLCEPMPGLDRARNLAARAATGDLIAYTDDDVIVDTRWASSIEAAFEEEPDAMCVTGLVVPDAIDTDAHRLFEKYGGFGRGFDRAVYRTDRASRTCTATMYGGTGRFGTGANMAFRREFFEHHGYFDPALDVGTPTNGGGDLDMFFRVLKCGAALVYEPAAIVRHRHRDSYSQLRSQITNNGMGFYSYLVRTACAYPDESAAVVRLGAWWLWWWNVRRMLRGSFPADLILAELKGSVIGVKRYGRSRRWLAEDAA